MILVVRPEHLRRRPMETFAKLFERWLVFVYHCFDRIVIQGYMPLLSRPAHVVHFFRDVHGQYPITPKVLAKRTPEYRGWVEAFARNHKIPMLKAEKGVSKEKCVLPHLQRMERRNQHGVCCIFTSMEMGSTFQSRMPQFPTDDPDYRIIRRIPSRYLHYYFYIRDPVIGPLAMCVGTYLPFQTTYYLNGHNFIEIELRRQGVTFRKDDNAFLATADPQALQAAADKLSASIIEKRLNYWSWLLCPKFSEKDRQAVNLRRAYSINQIEYCRNFIFKRHFPIHKIFEHSCEMGLFRLAADKVAPHLRRPRHQTTTRQAAQRARKTRPWPSRNAHLLQKPRGPYVREVQHLPASRSLRKPDEGSGPEQGTEEPGSPAPQTRTRHGSICRFRSAIPERARRLSAVPTDCAAGYGRQDQNRRHQDSRHADDAADGGAAPRRHATQRMAKRRHPSGRPHDLRPLRQR